jgi:hypothetical protein
MPDPFDGQEEDPERDESESLEFFRDRFWPAYAAVGDTQLARCSGWCVHAPWPDPATFVVLDGATVLYSRLCYSEPESWACQLVTVSAFAIDRAWLELLERDLQLDAIPLSWHGAFGSKAGLSGDQCYKSPSLVCWAPWIDAAYDAISYCTITPEGDVQEIVLRLLAASSHWSCGGREHEFLLPSPTIRDGLGITVSVGGSRHRVYQSADAQEVAVYNHGHFRVSEFADLLRVRSDRLAASLASKGQALGWVVELYREVPPQLYPDSERQDWTRLKRLHVLLKDGEGIRCVWSKEVEEGAF